MNLEHKKLRIATLNTLNNPKLLSERAELIVNELRVIQPDIISFQEVLKGTSFNLPAFVQKELGLAGYAFGDHVKSKYEGVNFGNVILSKTPIESSRSLGTATSESNEIPSLAISTTVRDQKVEIINVHFAWGGNAESARTQQAILADRYARRAREAKPGAMVLITGDFNAEPDSDTNRYLNGKTSMGISSTLWTDAWDTAGQLDEEDTVRIDNEFAKTTAQDVGIAYPEMMPQRRIDYIKAYGFTYGRTGSPLLCRRWATSEGKSNLTISDHFGLYADFLMV